MALTELNGPCAQVIANAKKLLPKHAAIDQALSDLSRLVDSSARLSKNLELSIDLSDLRGYQYHSGVMFAAYIDKLPSRLREVAAMTMLDKPLVDLAQQQAFL
jgi:ATP phosphoribosyltransferase regulatory subunit